MASTPTPELPTPELPADDAEPDRALVVVLGATPLAIAAGLVDAVVPAGPVTPVPGPAPWLLGVTAVRGRVLPVADLGRLVGLAHEGGEPAARVDGTGWFVVIDDGARAAALAGLTVRRVAVCRPADAADAAAPPGGEAAGLPLRGVARLERDTVRGGDAIPPAAARLDTAALLDLIHHPTDGG